MKKFRILRSFSMVYYLPNSGEWMESYEQWMETYEQKKHPKKQSEVQVDIPRSSGSSRGAFSKNQFRDKGRTNDLVIFVITRKRLGVREKPST